MTISPQERIVRRVVWGNWLLFGLVLSLSLMLAEFRFVMGVLAGGLLVTANFHMLARTLKAAFRPPHIASVGSVIGKYYLRFALSGAVIMVLVGGGFVAPLGLILGLSVVVMSLFVTTIVELANFFSKKEAS